MLIKDQIQISREAIDMTKKEFAERLGLSVQAISWWENGDHNPAIKRIPDIQRVLKVELDMSEKGPPTIPKGGDGHSLGVDPEVLKIAVSLAKLPADQRRAIVTLIKVGEAVALGKRAESFAVRENNEKRAKNFYVTGEGENDGNSIKGRDGTERRRHGGA